MMAPGYSEQDRYQVVRLMHQLSEEEPQINPEENERGEE